MTEGRDEIDGVSYKTLIKNETLCSIGEDKIREVMVSYLASKGIEIPTFAFMGVQPRDIPVGAEIFFMWDNPVAPTEGEIK